MRRFYTKHTLSAGQVEITGDEAYHMQTVLRLNVGDACVLVNDKSQTAKAVVTASFKNMLTLDVATVEKVETAALRLVVLQGYLKERKLDDLVRPLSELGVTEFCAVFTERSVPAPDKKRLALRLERWRKLAVEALKQCRGGALMQVAETVDFTAALNTYATSEVKLLLWEGAVLSLKSFLCEIPAPPQSVAVLLGPEGGFTEREVRLAQAQGFVPVSLGTRILRAQTAAVTAAALVQYAWGDLG